MLKAFKKLIGSEHTSAMYVSHDLAVVAQIADIVLVLKEGDTVELGTVEDIIHRPVEAYTQQLIGAAHVMPETLPEARPHEGEGNTQSSPDGPLLGVGRVTAGYGRARENDVLRNVSLEAFEARTVGVIGESGSGKTTLGRVISGLMPVMTGHVDLDGQRLDDCVDKREREQLRSIQFAFQMADVALNPRHRIGSPGVVSHMFV